MQRYFITGIGTEVGKTVVSAIATEALQADYWKPVQAGELEYSDTDKVKDLVSNTKTKFHKNSFALKTPMSPHAAAEIDAIHISAEAIITPKTTNNLVVEGAGGLLVPLNTTETILDIILPTDKVILVSRHYLGSINHTLLSIEALKNRGIQNIGIIFNGEKHPSTESIIEKQSGVAVLGRINQENKVDIAMVNKYAGQLKQRLTSF